MTRLVARQMIDKDGRGDPRSLEERMQHWERAMVGQLARETHAAGEKFVGWPTANVIEDELFPTGLVLDVEVVTEPRS